MLRSKVMSLFCFIGLDINCLTLAQKSLYAWNVIHKAASRLKPYLCFYRLLKKKFSGAATCRLAFGPACWYGFIFRTADMMHMLCLNINSTAERLHQNVGFGEIRMTPVPGTALKKNTHRERKNSDRGIEWALCFYYRVDVLCIDSGRITGALHNKQDSKYRTSSDE